MKKIAIALSKGGVGKTTTAVNLSAGLAKAGKTVLIIDTDTQGQVARALGCETTAGLAELILGESHLQGAFSQDHFRQASSSLAPQRPGDLSLGVCIDYQHGFPRFCQPGGQVDRRGGFPNPPF